MSTSSTDSQVAKKPNNHFRQWITAGVCGTVMLACIAAMVWILAPYFQAEYEMAALRIAVTEEAKGEDFPVIDWEALQKENPDICGWVVVPGTGIDYPVVAAPKSDPDYYLHRDLDGGYSVAGVPYLDAACERDWSSRLSAVYGHHLINDGMFSPLARFSDEDFFRKHRKIYLLTPNESMLLTAVAANVVNADKERIRLSFTDDADFHKYWQRQVKASEVVANDTPKAPSQVFAFMTCSYQTSNSRTMVYAVRSEK